MAAKEKKVNLKQTFTAGIWKENPVLKMLLGLCPVLGVTSSFFNAVGFGVIVIIVLLMTNSLISLVGKYTPDAVRIPVYITIIASAVTVVEMLVHAFMPDLYATLGIFLPLITVNCIILGRAEAFAAKNKVLPSMLDGAGYGIGLTIAMGLLAFIRELLGTGAIDLQVFVLRLFPEQFGISLLVLPTGSFLVLGAIIGIMVTIQLRKDDEKKAAQQAKIAAAKAAAAAKKAAAEAGNTAPSV